MGTNEFRNQLTGRVMIVAAVVITFLKAYLVGMEFMEVHGAPAVLRGLLTGWASLLAVAVTTLYLA